MQILIACDKFVKNGLSHEYEKFAPVKVPSSLRNQLFLEVLKIPGILNETFI